MNNSDQSKYQTFVRYFPLWLLIWYFLGVIYVLVITLPSVSNWSIQESITREGTLFMGSYHIESDSIVNVLFFAILWPVLLLILYTIGWMFAGEIVGYAYDPSSPTIIIIYYVKLTLSYLPIFLIGLLSGLIVLILVKYGFLITRQKKPVINN